MVDKNRILISYYREGKSKSEISRMLKISRKTVRKNDLTEQQIKGIQRGLKDIDEGKVVSHDIVKKKYGL